MGAPPRVLLIVVLATLAGGACSFVGSVGSDASGTGGAGAAGPASTVASSGSAVTAPMDATPPISRVDLLLAIDNSESMGDGQSILALTLADLVGSLTDPPCRDGSGKAVSAQPASALDPCPAGSARRFAPVTDIHLGVITASLGAHGGDACPASEIGTCAGDASNGSSNDRGHLVTRVDPCGSTTVPTYQDQGFLAWDPGSKDAPPGTSDPTTLTESIQSLTVGAGEIGCLYPSQLESWYRFLVEPKPYGTISVVDGAAVQSGVDPILLSQRQDFLRSDSLVAILMLSDHDDCSIVESGQGYYAAQLYDPEQPNQTFHMPRARQECAADPNDPCCRSCAQDQTGCPVDPLCASSPLLDAASDDYHLRCWDQKRRFGMDLLYGTARYVGGLTQPTVVNSEGETAANPLFSPTDPGAAPRDPSLVILGGILGVPWQDLARDPADLTQGYQTAAELAAVSGGVSTWDVILGTPASGKPPLDPHLVEATAPRAGTDPVTGTSLAPPTAASGADPISGHEFTQAIARELQYACIYPLAQPRDCTDPSWPGCDCADPENDKPLCEPDPAKNGQRTLQVRAKAYPPLRQLAVLHALGTQSVVASICPAQTSDPARADYAYQPAIQAFVDRIGVKLAAP